MAIDGEETSTSESRSVKSGRGEREREVDSQLGSEMPIARRSELSRQRNLMGEQLTDRVWQLHDATLEGGR